MPIRATWCGSPAPSDRSENLGCRRPDCPSGIGLTIWIGLRVTRSVTPPFFRHETKFCAVRKIDSIIFAQVAVRHSNIFGRARQSFQGDLSWVTEGFPNSLTRN